MARRLGSRLNLRVGSGGVSGSWGGSRDDLLSHGYRRVIAAATVANLGLMHILMRSRQNREDQTVMRYQQYSYACAFGTEAGVSDQFDFAHVFVPSIHCKGSATPAWNNTLTCK